MISSTCGQTVSHGGVWNLIQQLGGRISEEEKVTVSEMNADQAKGTAVIPVLFEEMMLYNYLNNNKDGLLPYQDREIKIPEAPEHLVYKGMGVQENQNCTTITLRMKHRRMRWSSQGANNMAKVLYTKENKELSQTIERYTDGLIFAIQMEEVIQSQSAAKAPKKDGKGNPYAIGSIITCRC